MLGRKKIFIVVLLILIALATMALFTGMISIPSAMDIYGCSEMFSRYYVDADIVRQNIPSDWQVKIGTNGKATMLVMVQRCEKMVLDYVINVGAVGMSHIWLEVEGPEEFVPPLAGTTRSLPTRYWYILPHQFDNQLACALIGFVGIDTQCVKDISLEDPLEGARSGEVIETDSPKANYSWIEESQLFAEPDIVTGSQHFYRKYGVRESEAVARCESHFLGDSQVKLEVSPSSALGQLDLGDSLEGFSNPVWVELCHVNYRVDFFHGD